MASFEPQDQGLDEPVPPPRPTTPPVRRGFLLVLLVLCLAAVLVYGIPHVAEQTGYAWEAGRARAATEALAKLEKSELVSGASALFRLATVKVSPAVVNIQTQRYRAENPHAGGNAAPFGGPRFGRGALEVVGIGSGVIIDKDNGYVVTNNHVINDADQITVRLSQGAEVPAILVGADPKTDLAVLRIQGQSLRLAAEWGDSEKLAIGDWVLAIGSPYMLDHTVTAGIVSATGRNNLVLPGMDESAYQDFIQTDAAINPGNSGGPLVDLNGRVVGINTAILTSNSFLRGDDGGAVSGGFEGIGLAIPASMARRVVEDLIKKGKVERGYMGIVIQPLTPALAADFGVPQDVRGAIVAQVKPDGPADQAKLKAGDIIVAVDGKETADRDAVRNRIAEISPGKEVEVAYFRDGKKTIAKVKVGDLATAGLPVMTDYGFRVEEVTPGPPGVRKEREKDDEKAAKRPTLLIIAEVVRGSAAARAGVFPGMRVVGVGKTEVHTLAEFEKAASKFSLATGLPLHLQFRDGSMGFRTIGGPGTSPR